jgi:hypothetical protein
MKFGKTPGPADVGRPVAIKHEENIRPLPRGNLDFRQVWDGGSEPSADDLGSLLGKVSETSRRELDTLIEELEMLRGRLRAHSNRIEDEIAKYATLSSQVMQLTRVISDSFPQAPPVVP